MTDFLQPPAPIFETLPVPVSPSPAPTPLPDLTPTQYAKLAREIAMDMKELPDILKVFNLSPEQYERVKAQPFFQRVLEAATIEWNSALSTPQRLKVQAAYALEEGMPVLGARMLDKTETLSNAVETGKLFAKIAGVGEPGANQGSGEKFTITINLGADKEIKYERDIAQAPAPTPESAIEIRALGKGAPDPAEVQPVRKADHNPS